MAVDVFRGPAFSDALAEHLAAIAVRDAERFAATVSTRDVRLVGGDGSIIEGHANVVAAHRGWFAQAGWTFEPEILWMREVDGCGWALTRVRYTEADSLRTFLLFLLFALEEDGWRLVFDQNTPLG